MLLVFRDFPLNIHNNAQSAAEAAQCARAQGKFWEYHDKLFASQQALAVEQLKQYAKEIGLNEEAFNACFDAGTYRNDVLQDEKEGEQAGVSGTPAFFINGRFLSGALPYEAFASIIDEELKQRGPSAEKRK